MLRLTREVRFSLGRSPGASPAGARVHNSYGGYPANEGDSIWLRVCITLEGEQDPRSEYLMNITDIDREVRGSVVAMLAGRVPGPAWAREVSRVLADRFGRARVVAVALWRTPFLQWSWNIEEPEMVKISSLFEFSAAHRLHNPALSDAENRAVFGKCNNPLGHGHNYQVQVTVREGVPHGELERIVDDTLIKAVDHKHLNLEVPEFAPTPTGLIPSVENIAKVAYHRLKPELGAALVSVTVWETPKTWAEYSE